MKNIKYFLMVMVVLVFTVTYGDDLDRSVNIFSEVNQYTAITIRNTILELDKTEGDITIFIDSPGGSVVYGFVIIDAMNLCKNDVSTVVLGNASSMAAVILSAGTKGKRYAHVHSIIMLHQMSLKMKDIDLKVEEWYRLTELASKLEKYLCEEIAKNTEKEVLDIRRFIRQDRFMTSEEALAFGLIDGIIDGKEI